MWEQREPEDDKHAPRVLGSKSTQEAEGVNGLMGLTK